MDAIQAGFVHTSDQPTERIAVASSSATVTSASRATSGSVSPSKRSTLSCTAKISADGPERRTPLSQPVDGLGIPR